MLSLDRKIELVFIGQKLEVRTITKILDSCLLTDDELIEWTSGNFLRIDNWPIKNQ